MALRQGTPDLRRSGTRPLQAVPRAAGRSVDEDEFLFSGGQLSQASKTKTVRFRPAILLRSVLCVAVIVTLVTVVHLLMSSKPAPALRPVANTVSAAPAAPPVAARGRIPMSVVTSSLSPLTATHTYTAVATVRDPYDVPAHGVTVKITLRDASGQVVASESRAFGAIASGKTVDVVITGELDPSAPPPTSIEVSAVAVLLEPRV